MYSQTCIETTYLKEVGVKEVGFNGGKRINEYQKSTGNTTGAPYCSSFVKWSFDQCNIKTTITAWSPSSENSKNIIYKNRELKGTPLAGDVFTLYFVSKGRIAHTGFVHKYKNNIVETVEANTSEGGSREGDGVWKRKRSIYTIHSISRWN